MNTPPTNQGRPGRHRGVNRTAWVVLGVAVAAIVASVGAVAAAKGPSVPPPVAGEPVAGDPMASGTGAPADTGAPVNTSGPADTGAPANTGEPADTGAPANTGEPTDTGAPAGTYPWHTDIVATTFWVGEIFDPTASDGSQMYSTYDSRWYENYGGCDGIIVGSDCQTEPRTAANGYFPSSMTPAQNPFYLDLPYDDVNNDAAFARRGTVIPWATQPGYAEHVADSSFSLMKNRWVELRRGSQVCFGQIEDAGPGQYNDAEYVFGTDDARPENTRYGGAGMDVSPALNGCLGFSELDGDTDTVTWRFVDEADVPAGPWTKLTTTSGVIE